MRTARTFWLKSGFENTFEIITHEQMSQRDFRDTGMGLCVRGKPDRYGPTEPYTLNDTSGSFGVLSVDAYHEGHFAPPTVRPIAHGYSVVRWVVHYDKEKAVSVQEWSEFVGRNGEYTQKVIKTMPPPQLSATPWLLPDVVLL